MIDSEDKRDGVPRVSVSITAYNHQDYIAQTIEGALSQKTDFPFEICIGEDDSSDRTREICKEYAEKYPDIIRLFLRERKDMVPYKGRPTGRYNWKETIKACRGKYIALCDGDDYWSSNNKLQTQFNFLESNPEFSTCFVGSKKLKRGQLRKSNKHVPGEVSELADIVRRVYMPTAAVMFRADTISEVDEYYLRVPYMDHLIFCMAARYGKIKFIRKPMTVYRMHDAGVWSSQSAANRLQLRIEMRKIIAELLQDDFPEEADIARECAALDSLKRAAILTQDGTPDAATESVKSALELSPSTVLRKIFMKQGKKNR